MRQLALINDLQTNWGKAYDKHQEILEQVRKLSDEFETQKTKLEFQALIVQTVGVYIPLEKFRTTYIHNGKPVLRVPYQNLVFGNIRAGSHGLYLEGVDGMQVVSMITNFQSLFQLAYILKSLSPKNLEHQPEVYID